MFVVNNAKVPQDGVIRLFLKNDSGQFWSVNSMFIVDPGVSKSYALSLKASLCFCR